MAFAVKLGILVIKAVTKPFAKKIKNTKDKDLQRLCINVGQFQNMQFVQKIDNCFTNNNPSERPPEVEHD